MPSNSKFPIYRTKQGHEENSLEIIKYITRELERNRPNAVYLRGEIAQIIRAYLHQEFKNTDADFFENMKNALERTRDSLSQTKAYWEDQAKYESDPEYRAEVDAGIAEEKEALKGVEPWKGANAYIQKLRANLETEAKNQESTQ